MKPRTYMSTDWIEVHNNDTVYLARIFLTDEDKTYMLTIQNGERRFFKVDTNLLKPEELDFFEKVMENAVDLSCEEIKF